MDGLVERWINELRLRVRAILGDVLVTLDDTKGAKRFVLLDSDGKEIFAIDTKGNMRVSKLGARFLADFSNPTIANRFMFQTVTAGSQTSVYAIPGVGSTTAQFSVANNPDIANASILQLITAATYLYLNSTNTGSGTLLPLQLRMAGAERVTLQTDGELDVFLPGKFGNRYLYSWPFNYITSFTNSWVNNNGIHTARNPAGWYQDATGKVFLTGAISGGVNGNSAFTLPASQRPSATELFCIATSGGIGRVDVNAAGNVTPIQGSGTYYLDGISFYPAAYDGLFTAVSFTSSWVNYAGGFTGCGYYKDVYGRVHVRGLMKNGSIGSTAFNLPAGFRIWRNSIMAAFANAAFARLDYYSNGNIVPVTGTNPFYSVSGLMYPSSDVAPESSWLPLESLASGWIDYDAVNWAPAAAWIDPTGRVHLNGMIKNGSLGLAAAHALPAPWTPPRQCFFPVASSDAYGSAIMLNNGTGVLANSGSATWFSYGGVHWLVAC